jgi:hypothetical protein
LNRCNKYHIIVYHPAETGRRKGGTLVPPHQIGGEKDEMPSSI